MSRKSKREIERALESLSLETSESVSEWLESKLSEGFDYRPTWGDTDHSGEVCVFEDGNVSYYADESDVPEWIDAENDLPIR